MFSMVRHDTRMNVYRVLDANGLERATATFPRPTEWLGTYTLRHAGGVATFRDREWFMNYVRDIAEGWKE